MLATEKQPKRAAIDSWFRHVTGHEDMSGEIICLLRKEVPPILSWTMRGGCSVQCDHCIFPFEGPHAIGNSIDPKILIRFLDQLSGTATLIQEGRQLLPWQVPVLASVAREGYAVSMINNGQYAAPSMLALFEKEGLAIDVLDVSIDGPKHIHNSQRASDIAWDIAQKGIQNARKILKPNGKLTSLFTLTSRNYTAVRETGEIVTQLVDEWHVTTMSLRPGIETMRASERELAVALEQLRGNPFAKPVFLRSYSLDDFTRILRILGKETARKILANAKVTYNAIVLDIGVPLYFYPKSLWANEACVIDADGWWRMPYCVRYRLAELQAGIDLQGNDLSHFNVAQATPGMDVSQLHSYAAVKWWAAIGQKSLHQERSALQEFF